MSMIRVENITFSYPSSFDPVFENVSFQIDTEWKLGLVGRNGRGKTTLLKLLLGEYEYRGKITGAVTFDYFPFPVSDKTQMTEGILRQVCQNARQWELIRELSYLGIESEVLWRPFETMSNGEQTKALLAALFLKEEHFLLIDEPTNHLDVEGRRQMADYLKRKRGFILVSHAYPIKVGNNVWFGAGVQVMPGVTIGSNVVIGAGSVVVKDIPSDSVAVGNPCKVIRPITEEDKKKCWDRT